jgi:hypothetical protein
VRSRPLAIFVAELTGSRSLAFEAAHEEQALAFAAAPWFARELRDYLQSKRVRLLQSDPVPRIRPATEEETSAYLEIAREFADMTGCFLFAPVW